MSVVCEPSLGRVFGFKLTGSIYTVSALYWTLWVMLSFHELCENARNDPSCPWLVSLPTVFYYTIMPLPPST